MADEKRPGYGSKENGHPSSTVDITMVDQQRPEVESWENDLNSSTGDIAMEDASNPSSQQAASTSLHLDEIPMAVRAIRYVATRDINVQMERFQFDPNELPMPYFKGDREMLARLSYERVPMDLNWEYTSHWVMRRGRDGLVPLISKEAQLLITTKVLIPLSRLRNPEPSIPFEKGERSALKDKIFAGMDEVATEITKTMRVEYGQTEKDYFERRVKQIVEEELWDQLMMVRYELLANDHVRMPM